MEFYCIANALPQWVTGSFLAVHIYEETNLVALFKIVNGSLDYPELLAIIEVFVKRGT